MARQGPALILILLAACSSGPGERDPEAAKRYYAQGQEAARNGEHVEAIDCYTDAVGADPEFPDAYFQRGYHYLECRNLGTPPYPTRELVDRALMDYSVAIKLHPGFGDAYFSRAMIWASRANYKQAVEDLLVCSRYKGRDPEPQLLLGELYEYKFENMGLTAMKHYEKYVELGGTNELVREKVKIWKQLQAGTEPPKKEPTAEDEKKAEDLHKQMLGLIAAGKEEEAWKVAEEIVTKYAHTKYFKEKAKGLQATYNYLKEKYGKPK